MTATRCPACDAALPEGAPWCTLCFTDLRPPEPEPQPELAPEPEFVPEAAFAPEPALAELVAVPAAAAALDPLGAGYVEPERLEPGRAVDVLTDENSTDGDSTDERLSWPCVTCDRRVPLELPACPTCGSSFLGTEHQSVSLRLPVVGDIAALSPAGRYALMAVGATLLSGLLFLVLLILGQVF